MNGRDQQGGGGATKDVTSAKVTTVEEVIAAGTAEAADILLAAYLKLVHITDLFNYIVSMLKTTELASLTCDIRMLPSFMNRATTDNPWIDRSVKDPILRHAVLDAYDPTSLINYMIQPPYVLKKSKDVAAQSLGRLEKPGAQLHLLLSTQLIISTCLPRTIGALRMLRFSLTGLIRPRDDSNLDTLCHYLAQHGMMLFLSQQQLDKLANRITQGLTQETLTLSPPTLVQLSKTLGRPIYCQDKPVCNPTALLKKAIKEREPSDPFYHHPGMVRYFTTEEDAELTSARHNGLGLHASTWIKLCKQKLDQQNQPKRRIFLRHLKRVDFKFMGQERLQQLTEFFLTKFATDEEHFPEYLELLSTIAKRALRTQRPEVARYLTHKVLEAHTPSANYPYNKIMQLETLTQLARYTTDPSIAGKTIQMAEAETKSDDESLAIIRHITIAKLDQERRQACILKVASYIDSPDEQARIEACTQLMMLKQMALISEAHLSDILDLLTLQIINALDQDRESGKGPTRLTSKLNYFFKVHHYLKNQAVITKQTQRLTAVILMNIATLDQHNAEDDDEIFIAFREVIPYITSEAGLVASIITICTCLNHENSAIRMNSLVTLNILILKTAPILTQPDYCNLSLGLANMPSIEANMARLTLEFYRHCRFGPRPEQEQAAVVIQAHGRRFFTRKKLQPIATVGNMALSQ